MRIERLKQEFSLTTEWVAFPLHPETPSEGRSLSDLFAGRDLDLDGMLQHLQSVAAKEGLPFGLRDMTYNSRAATELAKYAEGNNAGDAWHHAVFTAYFVDGLNIGDPEVLGRLLQEVGLDPTQGLTALDHGQYKDAVDRDWSLSRQMRVTAVPTFVYQGRGLVGAQPYDRLRQLVTQGLPRA